MTIEAMKQALEALECLFGIPEQFTGKGGGDVAVWTLGGSYRAQQAIPVLRQAIEQAEKNQFNPDWDAMAVMVDEQQRMAKRIEELEQAEKQGHEFVCGECVKCGASIEKQEPVAWISKEDYEDFLDETKITSALVYNYEIDIPLYTTPPQPEPVIDKSAAVRIATALGWEPKRKPLTDEELYKVFPAIATYHEANKTLYRSISRAIEAAHGIWPENSDCHGPDWTDRDGEYLK